MPSLKTLWVPVSAALTGLVLIGGAYAAYDEIRPWVTKVELHEAAAEQRDAIDEQGQFIREIAGVSLTTAINQKYYLLALERREYRICEKQGQNCARISQRIQELEQDIKDMEAKRAKYGG